VVVRVEGQDVDKSNSRETGSSTHSSFVMHYEMSSITCATQLRAINHGGANAFRRRSFKITIKVPLVQMFNAGGETWLKHF